MTSFNEREKAQENKYAYEEEIKFKALARAAKLFGQWSAERLGVPPEAYAEELLGMATSGHTMEEIIHKVQQDSVTHGKSLSADLLIEKFGRCMMEAKQQVLQG